MPMSLDLQDPGGKIIQLWRVDLAEPQLFQGTLPLPETKEKCNSFQHRKFVCIPYHACIKPPFSPLRPQSRPHPSLPTRPRKDNEFSRGVSGSSANKVLFDPTKVKELRRVEPSTKKLFDPVAHDPRSFTPLAIPPSLPDTESASSPSATAKRLLRRAAPGAGSGSGSGQSGSSVHTFDIDADRERERRRRREGSERGSTLSGKKKDSDARSKGSKSSEGSESLKDRERGKGRKYVQRIKRDSEG